MVKREISENSEEGGKVTTLPALQKALPFTFIGAVFSFWEQGDIPLSWRPVASQVTYETFPSLGGTRSIRILTCHFCGLWNWLELTLRINQSLPVPSLATKLLGRSAQCSVEFMTSKTRASEQPVLIQHLILNCSFRLQIWTCFTHSLECSLCSMVMMVLKDIFFLQ